jgi:hypothetical protein
MKGTLKRTTAAILAALLLATAGTATVTMISGQTSIVEAAESETTTITPSYDWYDNSSSSTNYTISTVADLVGLANIVNGTDSRSADTFSGKTITLKKSIDLSSVKSWTPIGKVVYNSKGDVVKSSSHPFAGTFEGGENVVIQNLTYETSDNSAGIFGYVTGTVQNLNVDNIHITNTTTYTYAATGLVVATLNDGTVDGITTSSNCTVSGTLRTGGIVGESLNISSVISNCENNATVTGSSSYTGGIVGAMHNIYTPNIFIIANATGTHVNGCTNNGTVTGTSEVGGISGYADRGIIEGCENTGKITGTGNYGTGGILGCDIYNPATFYKPKKASTITGCINSGVISAPRAGGILGSFVVAPGDTQPTDDLTSTISDCKNFASIYGTEGKCGVIFGYQISYAKGDGDDDINHLIVAMVGCENTGTVNNEEVTKLSPSNFTTKS